MGCESHTELFCFDFIDWAFNNGVGSRFAIRKLDLPRLSFGTTGRLNGTCLLSHFICLIGIAVLRVPYTGYAHFLPPYRRLSRFFQTSMLALTHLVHIA